MITQEDVPKLMKAITTAIGRHKTASGATTLVIISTAGRGEYNTQHSLKMSECTWRFARILTHEAHKAGEQGRHRHHHVSTSPVAHILVPIALTPPAAGFPVLEREEIERRLLYRSEHYMPVRSMKPVLHLENPASNIVATSLLVLISCLRKNETSRLLQVRGRAGRWPPYPQSPRLPVRAPHAASWVLQAGRRTRLLAA